MRGPRVVIDFFVHFVDEIFALSSVLSGLVDHFELHASCNEGRDHPKYGYDRGVMDERPFAVHVNSGLD